MKPYFSVIIPTYNRADDLVFATRKLLNQTFKNFEVIIIDNSNSNDTEKNIKKIADKRIRYIKNKKNIGWILSVKKGIFLAKGNYILLQGDDDFIINNEVLQKIYIKIKNENFGFIRLNYLSRIGYTNMLLDFRENKKYLTDTYLTPQKNSKSILEFIRNVDPFFLTGIMFKNNHAKNVNIINSELSPWIKIIFNNAYMNGACYLSEYYYVAEWKVKEKNSGHPFFYLNDGKFSFESYFEVIRKIDQFNYKNLIKKDLEQMIKLFPANKFSTSNNNLVSCAKRLLYLEPDYNKSIYFWSYLIASLLCPKVILGFCKKYFLIILVKNSNIKNKNKILKEINLSYQSKN